MRPQQSLRWYMECYHLLPLFILSCLSFNTWEGKHYISRLVVIMLVVTLFAARGVIIYNFFRPEILKATRFWLGIAFIMSCYHFLRGETFSTPRTIIVSLIYMLVVPWHNISRQSVLLIILLGGCVAGVSGLYERAILNIARVGSVINEIPFALYVAITLLIAIHTLNFFQSRSMKLAAWLAILGSTFAVITSEVRGVWLAFGCVALFSVIGQLKKLTVGKATLMVVITLVGLLFLSSIEVVENRIIQTKNEFVEIANGNQNTSIGIRFQLWRSAIDIIESHPFMGVGTEGYKNAMESQYQQGLITSTALSFKNAHFHNQYLDSYVRYGVIGLVLVIIIFLSPGFLYRGRLNISISILLLSSGLTDVPLMHTGIIYMVVLYPAVIIFSGNENVY